MRLTLSGLAVTGLLLSPCARAQQCASQSDQTVFDLQALKSSLMVLATGCPDSDHAYNEFVSKYKPELGANDRALAAYFKKVYGRSAQREQDAYVTNLANAQSDSGVHQGSDFCPRTSALFSEVMALRSATDLPEYAAGKDLIPAQLGACAAPPAAAPTRARVRTASAHVARKH
jgi:hypothetical protein